MTGFIVLMAVFVCIGVGVMIWQRAKGKES